MPCKKCGDRTDRIFMTRYVSAFAVVCEKRYTDITKKGK